MDILYYSNYCKHSQKLLQYLVKNNLTTKLNCINIDKRKRNAQTNQTQVFLENGSTVMLPLNVHSVPSLLLVNDKYKVIVGEEIYKYFTPKVSVQTAVATNYNGEPEAYVLGSTPTIMSEQYTYYNMSPDELSAKGRGGMRQMYNYVAAMHSEFTIPTPPDNYRPDKIGEDSVEKLQQKRNEDLGFLSNMPPPNLDIGGNGGAGMPNAQVPPIQYAQQPSPPQYAPPPQMPPQYAQQPQMPQYSSQIPMPPIQNLAYTSPQNMTQPPSYSPSIHPPQYR